MKLGGVYMQTATKNKTEQSDEILDQLCLSNNLYVASLSREYGFIWLRDSFYMNMRYFNKNFKRFVKTLHAMMDIIKRHKGKLKIHTYQKPIHTYEYLHPRYTIDGYEVNQDWGNIQHDSTAAVLWMIGEAYKKDKSVVRDDEDLEILQMLVDYMDCVQVWSDPDMGLWEEHPTELHSSSVGACLSSLLNVQGIVHVPNEMIQKCRESLNNLLPRESITKDVDSAQLSLIYPFNIVDEQMAKTIIHNVETQLLREKGVLRYKYDSYLSTIVNGEEGRYNPNKEIYDGTEMQWTMFVPWLAICNYQVGNVDKAREYLKMTENLFDENGYLPEGYKADGNACPNNPLGWSHSLHLIAAEMIRGETC
jgi:phosphorylase kinase alpha/beta subunit